MTRNWNFRSKFPICCSFVLRILNPWPNKKKPGSSSSLAHFWFFCRGSLLFLVFLQRGCFVFVRVKESRWWRKIWFASHQRCRTASQWLVAHVRSGEPIWFASSSALPTAQARRLVSCRSRLRQQCRSLARSVSPSRR